MDDEQLIEYGLINLSESSKPMTFFNQKVSELIIKHEPEIIGWEELKSSKNADTIRKLGEYAGILRRICEEYNLNNVQAIPISVKAAVCKKKGTKTKYDLAVEISSRYEEIELPPDEEIFKIHTRGKNKGQEYIDELHQIFNITDAIGIGLYCYYVREGIYKPNSKSGKKKGKKI